MISFTIKDLENLSGIKAHTLRIWEQRYNFLKPLRSDTNIRYYNNDELKVILNIAILNKYGFKVSHINRMTEEERIEKILSLHAVEAQNERVVNDLLQRMIDMDIKGFEEVLDLYIATKGIEKTITQIIFPYLEKIGILWMTNHVNPAQEHLVSNIIRQKLIVGIDRMQQLFKLKTTVLLFLPENEHHELGLLFLHYILKQKGVNVIYLGADIPLKDVAYVVQHHKTDYIYTHLTTVTRSFNIEKFIQSAMKIFPHNNLVISGGVTQGSASGMIDNARIIRSFSEVMQFVHNLS